MVDKGNQRGSGPEHADHWMLWDEGAARGASPRPSYLVAAGAPYGLTGSDRYSVGVPFKSTAPFVGASATAGNLAVGTSARPKSAAEQRAYRALAGDCKNYLGFQRVITIALSTVMCATALISALITYIG